MAAHKFRRLMLLYRKKLRKATWTSGGKQSGAGACAVSAFVRSGDGGRLRGRGERADCLFCRRGRADVPRTGERPYSRAKAFDAVSASGAKKETRRKRASQGMDDGARRVAERGLGIDCAAHVRGAEDAGATAMLAAAFARWRTACWQARDERAAAISILWRFCGAGRGGHGSGCIVSMRVGDIMLAAAKAARKKKRKEGLPWRSIPSKA